MALGGQSGRAGSRRSAIAFRAVNARGSQGYYPDLQRHHVLPLQLVSKRCFAHLFASIGRDEAGLDDFRRNGLLLPATEAATLRTGMPLHRGPHRRYNEMVIERVGCIEHQWSIAKANDNASADDDALMRLQLLQSALRKRLLDDRRRLVLNRKDPLGAGFDFTELDAMAETLWQST